MVDLRKFTHGNPIQAGGTSTSVGAQSRQPIKTDPTKDDSASVSVPQSSLLATLLDSYELAKLYTDRGDFFKAIEKLKETASVSLREGKLELLLKSYNLLLRLYAETEQSAELQSLKEHIQDLVLRQGLELNSRTYYTLALCASYKNQDEMALEYLQKALALALQADSKEDMCYAISGLALVYSGLGRYDEALKEIYNLQVFFEVLELPEVRVSIQLLNGWILRELGRLDQAIEVLWQAYDTVRQNKTAAGHINILFSLGKTYLKAGDQELARLYLNLAWKAVDPSNMVRLARQIRSALDEAGQSQNQDFDLIFELENHSVIEKRLGKVDFKNQFILLDLLKLFVQNQGQVYSKEYLVEHVWRQKYDPNVHDNKIYVTIKRLRKLIEPDFDKPKYIFRAKNGYFMNRSARVLLNSKRRDH